MIDAILTGMTGRISTLHKVEPVRSVKQEQTEEKAPAASLDNLSLSSEALELYRTDIVKDSEPGSYSENDGRHNRRMEEIPQQTAQKQTVPASVNSYGISEYAKAGAVSTGSLINMSL